MTGLGLKFPGGAKKFHVKIQIPSNTNANAELHFSAQKRCPTPRLPGSWSTELNFYRSQVTMDAAALLKSQGWRGKGYSLHPSDNSVGLANPLLLSRNKDGRGIGSKPHFTSDQWWLHAFDQKLKGLDTSKKGVVVQSETQGKLDAIATGHGKYSGTRGLYASFVRGGVMEGTINFDSGELTDATSTSENGESARNIRDRSQETKEERRTRREAKRLRKAERANRRAARAEAERKAAEKAAR